MVLVSASLGLALSATPPYRSAVVRTGAQPGVRMASGLTVCDEALVEGRWINRYWLSTGQVMPEHQLSRLGPLADAFELSIEGQDLAGSWQLAGITQSESSDPAGLLVTVELKSSARPVNVKIRTLLSGGPVMVRWLEITNLAPKATAITRVSPWAGRLWSMSSYVERLTTPSEAAFEFAHTEYSDQLKEGAWVFEPLLNSTRTLTGMRGKSGWGHPTFFARNRASGEWFVASLGWSGNWSMQLDARQDETANQASLRFSMGPAAVDPALRVLAAGETARSPEAHLLCQRGDLDQVIQALHEHVRKNVLPPQIHGREYQVEANHRGYIVDHEDEPGLKREIDLAAHIGAEMFVIDAGWYGPEPNRWWQNVGDWYAGKWLPNDLTPVREYARQKGLLFGLWMEVEGMGAATKLRQQHADWAVARDGRVLAGGRNLDLSKPEVAAWVEAEAARVIKKYDLDLFRIDYNMSVDEGGNRMRDGFLENTQWRYVEALYGIFDRLRARFPNVIFQNCASGGGRLDYGILRRFHNTEVSDMLRGPRSLKIFNGMTWLLPPEIGLRTFGTESGGLAADADLDFQLRQTLMGRPIFRGIAPTLDELNPELDRRIRAGVELFKSTLRPLMLGGRVYHHTPAPALMRGTPWVVMEYASADARRAVGWLFRTSQAGESTFTFLPRGLDRGHNYRVTLSNSGEIIEISGERLLSVGIPVRLESNQTSEMLLLEAR
jgi:alpha-galactosidase